MEARKILRKGHPALNQIPFLWIVFVTAAVSKHIRPKHVLNMVISDGETK